MTRAVFILKTLSERGSFTCQELTKLIIKRFKLTDNKAKYASGSVSSTLAKLVKDNLITVSKLKTGSKEEKFTVENSITLNPQNNFLNPIQ